MACHLPLRSIMAGSSDSNPDSHPAVREFRHNNLVCVPLSVTEHLGCLEYVTWSGVLTKLASYDARSNKSIAAKRRVNAKPAIPLSKGIISSIMQ